MALRGAILVGLTSVLVLGSLAMPSPTTGSILTAASPAAPYAELHFAQVRAEYVDLDGNRDETDTTLFFVNKSLTKTIYLGDVSALGPDGLAEVLAIHKGLNGVGIPPLGSLELPVDSAHFPGLQPKTETDSRGVESVLVSWSAWKEPMRLMASIHLQSTGSDDDRVITRIEGHFVVK